MGPSRALYGILRARRRGLTKLLSIDGEGERLDRFELIAELASGGMATVYLARLSGMAGFQRLYAIKRLHPHLAREPEFVDMFLDEARLAARIHHPHVVPILEIGQSGKGHYLVMEYIEGDTAARLFGRCAQNDKRVPWNVGVRIVLDTLAGLHAAHEVKDDAGRPLDVVHRDVSPQNVLVAIDGTSRLTDFGVARAATRLATTRSGNLKGKLAYMAPEQARGETIDRRADVFAAGVILWELLTFHRLFKSEGEAETLNRLLYLPIPTVRQVDDGVPVELERVTMQALARNPDERFRTALEMADALEAAARVVGMLGTPRDVAETLKVVLGTDLDAQREVVRQWMSRSEPSGTRSTSRPMPHALPSDAHLPGASSVSSAVIPVPPAALATQLEGEEAPRQARTAEPPGRSTLRAAIWGAAGAAILVAIGVGSWTTFRRPRPLPAPPVLASAPPLAAEPAPTPTNADVPVNTGSPLAAPPDTGTSPLPTPPPVASTPTPSRTRPVRPTRGGGRPASAPAPAATVPDDLSHNPYR